MRQMNPQQMMQQQQQQQQAVNPAMHPRFRNPHPQQAPGGVPMQQAVNPNVSLSQFKMSLKMTQPYFKSAQSPMTPNAPFTPSPLNNVSSPGSSQGPTQLMNQPNQANPQPGHPMAPHPMQQQQRQAISNDDQVLYMEKLKTLRKYIEPLSRVSQSSPTRLESIHQFKDNLQKRARRSHQSKQY